MATKTLKLRELITATLQGTVREAGRFVGSVASLPEPTLLLSFAASRPADATDPYDGCPWFTHVMNQGNLRAGRPAA